MSRTTAVSWICFSLILLGWRRLAWSPTRRLRSPGENDVYIHRGRPAVLFSELTNAFVSSRRRVGVEQMRRVFLELKKELPRLMKDAGTKSCFTARVFEDLRVLALRLSNRYVV